MATQTNIGMLQKQKLAMGLTASPIVYIGLDGDGSVESKSATAPAQELTSGGCSRVQITATDVSVGEDYAIKMEVNYVFSADNIIRAFFTAWSQSAGQNMASRHVLTLAQAVGPQDQMTVRVIDHLGRAA